jgi:8-oxo-dGTP diphosphatase
MIENHSKQKPIIKAASACVWRGDDVLLIQRASKLGHGRWSLPGGKQEAGETDVETAHRELLEETSVTAALHQSLGIFHIDAGDVIYAIHSYSGEYVGGDAKAGSDAGAVAWVNYTKLSDYDLAPNIQDAVTLSRKLLSL